jgi:GTPase Era involved in 16S rRNA processing
MNDDYICLVLGETGVGKSTFINGITQTKECKVSNKGKACTRYFKIVRSQYNGSTFSLIDTPGLNDAKGDEKNINQIKTALSDYPKFRAILILLKFQDIRLTNSTAKSLKILMQCFPLKNFWKHVFIVRTHADTSSKKFQREKAKILNSIVNSLNGEDENDNDKKDKKTEDDFQELKNYMIQKNIEFPQTIDEYYVDNDDEDPENFDNNETEFGKILNKIKKTQPMFKDITKLEYDKVCDTETFPVKQTWRTIKFIDYDGNIIKTSPFLSYEDEENPNYEVIDVKKRKYEIDTKSDCGEVRIKYEYYEIKVYNVNGKAIEGKECYKGCGWE